MWASVFALVLAHVMAGTGLLSWGSAGWASYLGACTVALAPMVGAQWMAAGGRWTPAGGKGARGMAGRLVASGEVGMGVLSGFLAAQLLANSGAAGAAAAAAEAYLAWRHKKRPAMPVAGVARWRHVKAGMPDVVRAAATAAGPAIALGVLAGAPLPNALAAALHVALCARFARHVASVVRLEEHTTKDAAVPFVATAPRPTTNTDGDAWLAYVLAQRDLAARCETNAAWRAQNVFAGEVGGGGWAAVCGAVMRPLRDVAVLLRTAPKAPLSAADGAAAAFGARAAAALCRASVQEDALGTAQLHTSEGIGTVAKELMEALVLSTQRAQQNRDDDASVARALADELTLAAGTVVGAFGPGVLGLMEAAPPTTLEKDGVFHPLAMASEWL